MTSISHELLRKKSLWQRLTAADWIYAAVLCAMALFAYLRLFHADLDIYEEAIFWTALAIGIALGWFYRPLRLYLPAVLIAAAAAVFLYAGDFSRNEENFLLKYLLSSQSAILWQCALIFLAFILFAAGAAAAYLRNETRDNLLIATAVKIAWAGAWAGLTGLFVRWHESWLLQPGAGHIPVSNLYEVFVLFMVIVALMFLYYAGKYRIYRLGAFVYLLQSVLVAFLLWYSLARGAQEIRPLIPALQSWWMKIHVPANFIGYGGFSIAAMLAVVELMAIYRQEKAAKNPSGSIGGRHFLPAPEVIEDIMYKMIAVGFLFFTIATILGALWAGQAWGRYWSWDPKETWAFIVWLNYAVWLHMRLVAGWRGKILAWWALVGLLITTFAFLGVNMFLSGLHSYGGL